MEKTEMKKIFGVVKEHVRQAQEEQPSLAGLSLEDISREIEICEEDILLALADQALGGELVGTDIIICFND